MAEELAYLSKPTTVHSVASECDCCSVTSSYSLARDQLRIYITVKIWVTSTIFGHLSCMPVVYIIHQKFEGYFQFETKV